MGIMGSYLKEPVTEKVSSDESNDWLVCGASSMQGWRQSQEDAHNTILDFDANSSFFAVYDGHGGHEVALYTSEKLPKFLKSEESYTKGEYDKALEQAFLGFDATLITPEILTVLKELATEKDGDGCGDYSEDEENVSNLYEEATMPIEQVMQKYKKTLLKPVIKQLAEKANRDYMNATSSAKDSTESTDGVSSSSNADGSGEVNSTENNEASAVEVENGTKLPEIRVDSPDSSGDNVACAPSTNEADKPPDSLHQNGDIESTNNKNEDVTSASAPLENGEVGKKGKGKALTKTKGVPRRNVKTRPKRSVKQMYAKLLDFESSEDSEDEDDKTFEGPNEESSDDEQCVNSAIAEEEDEEEEEEEESSEDDDDDDDDEDDDMDEDGTTDLEYAMNMQPGYNSGCTAVVALLKDKKLYVANAGDSRCIVCRKGQAFEMSLDHKPEDDIERDRVVKAGGKVSYDGRVNGGLNLSRAIGDHAYKQNKELSDKEQMITALPDVMSTLIDPSEDEFMVLACDGIWNFMSSQEVVEFVRPAIKEGKKLSKICEEMFDHCLSPSTLGDGTGCDNMTAIIVQFKSTGKRRSSTELEIPDDKRAKTEEAVPQEAEKSA